MKILSTDCFNSRGITYVDLEINDDGEAPLLDIYADVRAYRHDDGDWRHESTEVRQINLGACGWAAHCDGCWPNVLPVWNDDIAAACEAAWQDEREARAEAEAEAERRQG